MLARLVALFGGQVERLLRTYQHAILERQYQLGRVADAATELYVCSCVLNRLDATLTGTDGDSDAEWRSSMATGRYYLRTAARRIRRVLSELWDNDDAETTSLANRVLAHFTA